MSEDEKKISYHQLSKEALDLLEGDNEQRRLFLDFLSILEDVLAGKTIRLAGKTIKLDPPVFTPDEQEEKAEKLSNSLATDAGLRATARANRETVFALDAKGAGKFLSELVSEYNRIRLISHGRESFAIY